ncbi:PLC-like phosphodiesterase [Podospora australis]|uniref:PLC-like phosphodiesterase n=1 Tax=Podospora australis TaxID=1536484 RepID=A0AAN6WY74_9PEZI|nr:PLC-like phosphodiesterase [Podospora australis]
MVQIPLLPALAALVFTSSLSHAQQVISSGGADPDGTQAAAPCNNSPDLCSRAYNNVTHMGAHDSAFLRDASTGNSLAGNQFYNATVALSAGIRLLQAQVHNSNGVLELCHTTCDLLDAGSLQDWLGKIKFWLDNNNPNEVITILLVNSDNEPASKFGDAFVGSGISSYGFVPPTNGTGTDTNGTWPSLQAMINTNKRLVTFIASIDTDENHPYLLSEFDHVFETPYEITSPSQFGCDLDRPESAGDSAQAVKDGMMPLLNHFMYINLTSDVMLPNVNAIDDTNSPATTGGDGALGRHGKLCEDTWGGVKPVFMLVDFFDRGPAVEGADVLNGIQGEATGRTAPRDSAGATSAAAADRTRRRGGGVVALVMFLGFALFAI